MSIRELARTIRTRRPLRCVRAHPLRSCSCATSAARVSGMLGTVPPGLLRSRTPRLIGRHQIHCSIQIKLLSRTSSFGPMELLIRTATRPACQSHRAFPPSCSSFMDFPLWTIFWKFMDHTVHVMISFAAYIDGPWTLFPEYMDCTVHSLTFSLHTWTIRYHMCVFSERYMIDALYV